VELEPTLHFIPQVVAVEQAALVKQIVVMLPVLVV
jgi:hypothetical protein